MYAPGYRIILTNYLSIYDILNRFHVSIFKVTPSSGKFIQRTSYQWSRLFDSTMMNRKSNNQKLGYLHKMNSVDTFVKISPYPSSMWPNNDTLMGTTKRLPRQNTADGGRSSPTSSMPITPIRVRKIRSNITNQAKTRYSLVPAKTQRPAPRYGSANNMLENVKERRDTQDPNLRRYINLENERPGFENHIRNRSDLLTQSSSAL